MKKTIYSFIFLIGLAVQPSLLASISPNGAVRKCYKKVIKRSGSNNNSSDGNDFLNNVKIVESGEEIPRVRVSCRSLIMKKDNSAEESENDSNTSSSSSNSSDNNNNNNNIGSDDEEEIVNSPTNKHDSDHNAIFNYVESLILPSGNLIDNEACVNSLNNINKLLSDKSGNDYKVSQDCSSDFDLNGYKEGLDLIHIHLSSFIDEAITNCKDTPIWDGASKHQSCRILSKTGQTVCNAFVDENYEQLKYDDCLKTATVNDMWEFANWIWNTTINEQNGCYLKLMYDLQCDQSNNSDDEDSDDDNSDNIYVNINGSATSLKYICQSAIRSCNWPQKYTGTNKNVQCLNKLLVKQNNMAIEVFKKNGYTCPGTNSLPGLQEVPVFENINISNVSDSDDNEIDTDLENKKFLLSSGGTEPWTNYNQILGTIFLTLFIFFF